MSKSRKQQAEISEIVEDVHNENVEDINDEDSVYDEEIDGEVGVDADVDEEPDQSQQKDDDGDDDDDEEEEDETRDTILPKKRAHVYHQIPDSTEIKIVPPEKRLTSEYMTIYEYSMVVGTRATHIA